MNIIKLLVPDPFVLAVLDNKGTIRRHEERLYGTEIGADDASGGIFIGLYASLRD